MEDSCPVVFTCSIDSSAYCMGVTKIGGLNIDLIGFLPHAGQSGCGRSSKAVQKTMGKRTSPAYIPSEKAPKAAEL